MGFFLSHQSAEALARLVQLDGEESAPPLERMRAIRAVLHHLDADPAALTSVRDALAGGSGWPEIAEAAGLKPTAAKWRWQGTDDEIAARLSAGRKRSVRPSSVPTDLPGRSVAEAAAQLGVSAQAVYLQVTRGRLISRTVELADGRSYKRVFLPGDALPSTAAPSSEVRSLDDSPEDPTNADPTNADPTNADPTNADPTSTDPTSTDR